MTDIINIVTSKHTCTNHDVLLKAETMGYTKNDTREWLKTHAIYGEDGDGYFELYEGHIGDNYGYNKELIHIFEELLKESNDQPIMILD